jgi:anthranilate phosphoribosyltransferase
MREPHPFSQFVRILGRGKSLTRSLTETEAEQAMGLILDGDVLPEQLGAFLMLLRVKEESPEEIAGFVRAARARFAVPRPAPKIDLDWSSYAGKKRQLPWFLLAALRLASAGWRVLMHGGEGHTPGRLYTSEALRNLGLEPARDLAEAARRIERDNFAYLTLDRLSPRLDDLLGLKPILGLRSPVNSFARMLNPLDASTSLQGVFHPAYMALHRNAGRLLGQPRLAVFRGEGGEIERRPNKPCETQGLVEGEVFDLRWPVRLDDPRLEPDEAMNLSRLAAVWRGELEDAYADAAVAGTMAIALHAMGAADTVDEAERQADDLWRTRDRRRLGAAA